MEEGDVQMASDIGSSVRAVAAIAANDAIDRFGRSRGDARYPTGGWAGPAGLTLGVGLAAAIPLGQEGP